MGRRLVVIGCTGVIFLLMMTTFSTVVSAQKVQLNEMQKNKFFQIEDGFEKQKLLPPGWWYPGFFLDLLVVYLIHLFHR